MCDVTICFTLRHMNTIQVNKCSMKVMWAEEKTTCWDYVKTQCSINLVFQKTKVNECLSTCKMNKTLQPCCTSMYELNANMLAMTTIPCWCLAGVCLPWIHPNSLNWSFLDRSGCSNEGRSGGFISALRSEKESLTRLEWGYMTPVYCLFIYTPLLKICQWLDTAADCISLMPTSLQFYTRTNNRTSSLYCAKVSPLFTI